MTSKTPKRIQDSPEYLKVMLNKAMKELTDTQTALQDSLRIQEALAENVQKGLCRRNELQSSIENLEAKLARAKELLMRAMCFVPRKRWRGGVETGGWEPSSKLSLELNDEVDNFFASLEEGKGDNSLRSAYTRCEAEVCAAADIVVAKCGMNGSIESKDEAMLKLLEVLGYWYPR